MMKEPEKATYLHYEVSPELREVVRIMRKKRDFNHESEYLRALIREDYRKYKEGK
jgi:Arc/MetJ-type ribon-helix-helix transcriptional regulator